MQSITLAARHLTVDRAGSPVLADIDLTVSGRDRLGVVGPNGVGKSTLLAALSGAVHLDSGTVEVTPPNAHIALLDQERERSPNETVRAMLARRSGVAAVEADFEAATRALTADQAGAGEHYQLAFDRWIDIGVAEFPARSEEVWAQLGQPPALLDQATSTLSGGQAGRAALAAILLTNADVVLLDEPTNDLDFDGLARLEAYVRGFAGAMVIVSHDRAFLERTVTHVLELDEHSRSGSVFSGGWEAFLRERDVAQNHAEEAHDNYERTRADLIA